MSAASPSDSGGGRTSNRALGCSPAAGVEEAEGRSDLSCRADLYSLLTIIPLSIDKAIQRHSFDSLTQKATDRFRSPWGDDRHKCRGSGTGADCHAPCSSVICLMNRIASQGQRFSDLSGE